MRLLALLLAICCAAAAQALDGISAPVSRTVTLAPDEATFSLAIGAGLDSTTAQVKQALQTAGLPNPTVVATGLGLAGDRFLVGIVQMIYTASVVIPAGSAIETAKSLDKLRIDPPAPLVSVQYSVAFNPSQAKVDAMRQLVLPQLLDDSRKLAQSLAAAAGVNVGAIRFISDSTGAIGGVGVPAALERNGDFSGLLPVGAILGYPYVPGSNMQYTFSLNVVFATASEPRP